MKIESIVKTFLSQKYFIDSMIVDLHAMDCVLGDKKAKPKVTIPK